MISYKVMTESEAIRDQVYKRCETELFYPPSASWDEEWRKIREDVLAIEKAQFEDPSPESLFIRRFQEPATIVVLLRDTKTKKIVGFTYSIPLLNYAAGKGENFREDIERKDEGRKTAYSMSIALHPHYTGHRLSPKLGDALEKFLKEHRRYEFIEFDATEKNGYAKKVYENSKDRIVSGPYPHDSSLGRQVFFRERL